MSSKEDEPPKSLPGPWGFPFVGSAFHLGLHKDKTLFEWTELYGPVYALNLGTRPAVALHGYSAIHEALVDKASACSGRICAPVFDAMINKQGLFFVDHGEHWKKWREIAHSGLANSWETTQAGILTESERLKNYLSGADGKPINIEETLQITMANAVFQACLSRRFDLDDTEAANFLVELYATNRDPKFGKILFLTFLRFLPSYKSYLIEGDTRRKKVRKVLRGYIEDRLEDDAQSRDLVSLFFKAGPTPSLENKTLVAALIQDMLFAGSITTSSQLLWVILFVLKNPACMHKMQNELDAVLGDCENPTKSAINEKYDELHYTRAVVQEAMRLRCIAPTSMFHKATEDTTIAGYFVAKDTIIMPNLYSVHHDPITWAPDPESFRPERHLDTDGSFVNSDHVIPFSVGWRRCVGEKIARTEIFAHLVTIFKHFEVALHPDDVGVDVEGVPGPILRPTSYRTQFTSR
ncbi:cytochrome P450 2C13, male-specific [Ciona intestinalis]